MTYLSGAGLDRPLATPVVTAVVTSLGANAKRPRAIRPWTHAGYTRWRRAALRAMPVPLLVGGLLVIVATRNGGQAGTGAILGQAAVCWLAAAWMMARRR